jgi:hypothetical protein
MSGVIKRITILVRLIFFLFLATPILANDDMNADGFSEAANAFKDGKFVEATSLFKVLAEGGNSTAQYNYAALLNKGLGAPVDIEEAWFWAWRARLGGIAKAVDLTDEIKSLISQEKENALVERLNQQYEETGYEGDLSSISNIAIINFHALTEPNYEKSYIWALVAQAFGRTDVQDIIDECNDFLEIDQKISYQKDAKVLFNKIRK